MGVKRLNCSTQGNVRIRQLYFRNIVGCSFFVVTALPNLLTAFFNFLEALLHRICYSKEYTEPHFLSLHHPNGSVNQYLQYLIPFVENLSLLMVIHMHGRLTLLLFCCYSFWANHSFTAEDSEHTLYGIAPSLHFSILKCLLQILSDLTIIYPFFSFSWWICWKYFQDML